MTIQDLATILRWWLVVFGLGLVSFPLVSSFLPTFFDRGWAFAKVLGLALVTYWVWIMGSLKVLPFDSFSLILGIVLIFSTSYVFWFKQERALRAFLTSRKRLVVFEELMFFFGLLFWAFIRGHQPDINGLEKFMDFGFLNSLLRTRFFPPPDMWLAGETMNYYYFGHLATAVLTKLSGISSTVTYNLMIATLFAVAFTCAFSLGTSMTARLLPDLAQKRHSFFSLLGGLVSSMVLVGGGNLHTILKVLTEGADAYWYPDATRYIAYTIHEFPLYSFVVSDLHGHVNNIPFVLLTLALLFSFFLERGAKQRFSFSSSGIRWYLLGLGFLFGVLYMTNALDAPIYLLLAGVLALVSAISRQASFKKLFFFGVAIGIAGFTAIGFSLPFHLSFDPFTKGVALVHARSSIPELLVLWGFFLFVGLAFCLLLVLRRVKKNAADPALDPSMSRLLLGVFAFSAFLVVVPEVIYFQDIYIAEYHRANTMFKLVYQTFMLMSLLTGPVFATVIWRLFSLKKRVMFFLHGALMLIFVAGLVSILLYPYFAVRAYYDRLHVWRGLDGLSWLARDYPDDYAAVDWLRERVSGQPVIVEAVGESYTNFARVSANTGLPTVLGWRVHEWLWRGSFDEPALRSGEVERLYTSSDFQEVCEIIRTYSIEYVFIGSLERTQYPLLVERTFQGLGDLLFSQGDTRIYQIRTPCGAFSQSAGSVPVFS